MASANIPNVPNAMVISTRATSINRSVAPTATTKMRSLENATIVLMGTVSPPMEPHASNARYLIAVTARRSRRVAVALKDMDL